MATALVSTEFLQLVNYIKSYYGAGSDAFQMAQQLLVNQSLAPAGMYEMLVNTPGVEIWTNEYGMINGYSVPHKFMTSNPKPAGLLPNSNVTGSLGTGGSKVVKFPGTYHASGGMMSGLKTIAGKAMTVATWVSAGCAAVSAGISLGKMLDKAIYDINPDYWDENLPSMNPDTWGQIVSGNDLASKAFRFIFKVDENSDGTTAYMDENAVAYMAKYMALNDYFNEKNQINPGNLIGTTFEFERHGLVRDDNGYYRESTTNLFDTLTAIDGNIRYRYDSNIGIQVPWYGQRGNIIFKSFPTEGEGQPVRCCTYGCWESTSNDHTQADLIFVSPFPFTARYGYVPASKPDEPTWERGFNCDSITNPNNGETIYFSLIHLPNNHASTEWPADNHPLVFNNDYASDGSPLHEYNYMALIAACMWWGTEVGNNPPGVSDQPDAKLPVLNPDDTLFDILEALKLQFPEMWADPLIDDVPQPDGSVVQFRYVPVTVPDFTPEGYPITGTKLQADPVIDPVVDPDPYPTISYNFITNPSPSPAPVPNPLQSIVNVPSVDPDPQPDPYPLPENVPEVDPAPDTGTGTTPIIPPQSGTASALFQIYNPTLAEINSFGQWLWSTDLFDQLQKLFQNPIDAVIGLHKIYATPSTGATSTIKLGFLDSGVSSKLVTSQYVNVSCGSVDILETFKSVFDYAPYTSASLYLPFIGIVDLDINEIMRGTVSIIYNIDVLTGACLAQVTVTRDNAGGVLYTYTGNCAVQLPITSGSYQGIIQGLVSIAGIAATGGSAAPLAIAGAATHMSASVSHSGSISSNAGAMGIKTPYIVLSRPQVAMPGNYESIQGIPSNSRCTLSECSGYVKVKDVFSRSSTATSEEQELIEGLLKEGVYIS